MPSTSSPFDPFQRITSDFAMARDFDQSVVQMGQLRWRRQLVPVELRADKAAASGWPWNIRNTIDLAVLRHLERHDICRRVAFQRGAFPVHPSPALAARVTCRLKSMSSGKARTKPSRRQPQDRSRFHFPNPAEPARFFRWPGHKNKAAQSRQSEIADPSSMAPRRKNPVLSGVHSKP